MFPKAVAFDQDPDGPRIKWQSGVPGVAVIDDGESPVAVLGEVTRGEVDLFELNDGAVVLTWDEIKLI